MLGGDCLQQKELFHPAAIECSLPVCIDWARTALGHLQWWQQWRSTSGGNGCHCSLEDFHSFFFYPRQVFEMHWRSISIQNDLPRSPDIPRAIFLVQLFYTAFSEPKTETKTHLMCEKRNRQQIQIGGGNTTVCNVEY